MMKKKSNRRGFTMAELLIVVAIIGVLAAVSFVAVAQHQRSLERLERDSVAREIFVAAQNHLTMAQGQGYLGLTGDGIFGKKDSEDGVYYFDVYRGNNFSDAAPATLLDLMLPFGAIDETVRGGGSYIIRYHRDTATVMDVFYCSTDDRFGYDLRGADVDTLVSNWSDREGNNTSKRRHFTNGSVLGWYGGEEANELSRTEIYPPTLVVENADKLRVGIKAGTGTNGEINPATSKLKVTVIGNTSRELISFDLSTTDSRIIPNPGTINGVACDYAVILDDITTAGLHFTDLISENGKFFQPGEDITIQAVAFDNTMISNVGYSAEITVNSLYDKLETDAADADGNVPMSAIVTSIRHLENLDKRVSNIDDWTVGTGANAVTYQLTAAIQANDLSWSDFKTNTGEGSTVIYQYTAPNEDPISTDEGCYLPVNPTHALSYDGQGHSISNVKVDYAGEAGLFGTIAGAGSGGEMTAVRNLALIDFAIKQKEGGSGNAGALAGTLTGVKVSNVVAYDQSVESAVTAESGSAGGLIGSANGCTVEKSAASLIVKSETADAGGLIGSANRGSVTGCYAGGHTVDGAYDPAKYNVTTTAGKYAGGLIGNAVSTPIESSYSTCSATGATAGGLVGYTNDSITGCYATGLVSGTDTEGAFAGQGNRNLSNCLFLDIINERRVTDADGNPTDTFYSLRAVGNVSEPFENDAIHTIDDSVDNYEAFVGDDEDWKPASPYDNTLLKYYGGRYPLQTVAQLGETFDPDDGTDYFVAIHYGDWPAPEIFVINEQNEK